MSALRRPGPPQDTLYPRTHFFDEPRSPRGHGPLIAVALLAAAVGVFALTRSGAQPDIRPDPAAVTEAVQTELHTMFLSDLGAENTVQRSARTRSTAIARINGLRLGDTVAVRCHGRGKLHITRLAPDNTREMRTVPCGQTALTYLTNEGSLRTVLIQAANKEAWASWALLRPTSKPDTAILRTRLVQSASASG